MALMMRVPKIVDHILNNASKSKKVNGKEKAATIEKKINKREKKVTVEKVSKPRKPYTPRKKKALDFDVLGVENNANKIEAVEHVEAAGQKVQEEEKARQEAIAPVEKVIKSLNKKTKKHTKILTVTQKIKKLVKKNTMNLLIETPVIKEMGQLFH